MAPLDKKVAINDAPSQLTRWLRALEDGYAPVDGRTRSELLDFAPRFGALVYFYDLKNQRDGNWSEFFLADPVMVLASIDALDTGSVEEQFLRTAREVDLARTPERAFQTLSEGFELLLGLARRFDLWLRGAGLGAQGEAARLLGQDLVGAVEGPLSGALRSLVSMAKGAAGPQALGRLIRLDIAGMSPLWGLEDLPADGSAYRGATKEARARSAMAKLEPLLGAFLDSLSQLQGLARQVLPSALANGDHPPHLALYMAFVRLFRTAQDTVNSVSGRYAPFYHRDVLRLRPRGALPDSTYLTFTLADDEAVRSEVVPRGTLFPAGKRPDGQDILFASDNTVGVSRATVARRLALRVLRGPLVPEVAAPVASSRVLAASGPSAQGTQPPSGGLLQPVTSARGDLGPASADRERSTPGALGPRPSAASRPGLIDGPHPSPKPPTTTPPVEGEAPLTVVKQVLISEMPLEPAVASDPAAEPLPGWATFGAVQEGVTTTAVTGPAALGFALASSYLRLTGGSRVVTLNVPLSSESARLLSTRLEALAEATGLDAQTVFLQVLRESFTLQVSTEDGWLTVERYEPILPANLGPVGVVPVVTFFGLWFELPPSAPPVVPNGAAPAPDLPMLRALLSPEPVALRNGVEVHPVSLLDAVAFQNLELQVQVRDLTGVSIENTQGEVDPSTPWALFGASPVVGSYARLRHSELFVKRLDTLSLALDWFNLPSDKEGFAGYYRDYTVGPDGLPTENLFDNTSFSVDLRVLRPGAWTLQPLAAPSSPPCPVSPPSDDVPKEGVRGCLFRTKPDCDTPPPEPRGTLCQDTVLKQFDVAPGTPPDYYDPATSALELRLATPSYAFGDSLYTVNVLNAVLAELPDGSQPPPTEGSRILKDIKYPNPPWLPQVQTLAVHYSAHCLLDEARYFHLLPFEGFKQVTADPQRAVALLPHFKAPANLYLGFTGLDEAQSLTMLFQMSGTFTGTGEVPTVQWEWLTPTGWSPLPPDQVLSDSTRGLQGTGILTLGLPTFTSRGSTLMPKVADEGDYQWLRASVPDEAEDFPRTLALTPHAVTATRSEPGVDVDTPVPAGAISQSVQELPDIGDISQPMASFGGRPPETARTFEVRASERLRHKERAVLAWDYERLALERFPSLWKVKALPAHAPRQSGVPGAVLVVVVPGRDATASADPTVPQATSELLERVEQFLAERASGFAQVRAVNPLYVRVKVDAQVRFRAGEETGASLERLDRELVEYLSPWYFDASRATRQGQYGSSADVSDFIQTRPYVEELLSLELAHTPRPESLESDWYFLTSETRHALRAADAPAALLAADGY
ncbi:baseplate J/gp47 family protein [Myxococcus sp. K38C18041901]|uniref:baseplate J/gp47 family protein n=1 Tax=Myxococcus guangdongensis TaxID=2906760 RepID=UPI0020A7E821|nr:baseplate J/gp47 family protein [Myxococcus guangdongensis]MCP3063928.1 baseplate J/gp47 family protein [Myxococcus guangdongensis]